MLLSAQFQKVLRNKAKRIDAMYFGGGIVGLVVLIVIVVLVLRVL
jgi:hypothetical protein